MHLTNLLSVALFALNATAQFVGPSGQRFCVGGAISCQYGDHRCANICVDSVNQGNGNAPAFIDTICSCPEENQGAAFTGAACIDVIRALGRAGC